MELTTKSGHFLAIFDVDTPVARLQGLLDEMGVKPALRGDGAEPVPGETLDVLQMVHDYDGLVIAAHIERWPSGFLESKESRAVKAAIHASSCLHALEITVAQNRASWENGLVRGYDKKYACVQGSDAHTPAEIGRRPVYLHLPVINLVSLQTVFQNWQGNIAFSEKEFENGIY
jgi:PHP family Zn ribbon phosphoesterase